MRFFTPLRALAVSALALAIGATAGIVIAVTPADVTANAAVPIESAASAELLGDARTGAADLSRGASREAQDTDLQASVAARAEKLSATSEAIATREALEASVSARAETLAATSDAISATDAAIAQRLADEARAKAEAEALKGGTPAQNKELARKLARDLYGWGEEQFSCYDNIIMRESLWITTADNPTSSAYGIPQALPGKKMASEGEDWLTNPATQIKWGLKYVKERFGTPCQAWSFKRANGWY